MRNSKMLSVEMLGKLSNKGSDEVLLLLWDNGIDDVIDANDVLIGRKLVQAKAILGIPVATQLTSLKYWESVFGCDETELRKLLDSLNVPMAKNAKRMPTGAIKKLKVEARRRNAILQILAPQKEIVLDEILLNQVDWKIIGKKEEIFSNMELEEVINIHYALVNDFQNNQDPINPAGLVIRR